MLGFPVVSYVVLLDVIDYLNYVFAPFQSTDVVLICDVGKFDQSQVADASHVHFYVLMRFSETGFSLSRDIVLLLLEFVKEIIKKLRISLVLPGRCLSSCIVQLGHFLFAQIAPSS